MIKPNEHITALPASVHGGINYDEAVKHDVKPGDMLDFSVNINPFGPPNGIEECFYEAAIDRYPDSRSAELTAALAEYHNISPESLCAGAGTTELIRATAIAYLSRGDSVLIPRPTYSEYELATRLSGSAVINEPDITGNIELSDAASVCLRFDIGEIISCIRNHRPKAVFLCNPNNPTGAYLSRDAVRDIIEAASDSLVILDEAYIAFTAQAWDSSSLIDRDNLIILRSMTKDYALAGLRIGYMMSNPDIVSVIRRVLPPWNVSSVAQKAALYSLKTVCPASCVHDIHEAKSFLVNELAAIGMKVMPSDTNFFLVYTGDARSFRDALMKKRMLVRDCASFGLPSYIRIAPRTLPECRTLIDAMKQVIKGVV